MLLLGVGVSNGAAKSFFHIKSISKDMLVSYFMRLGLSLSTAMLGLAALAGVAGFALGWISQDRLLFYAVAVACAWFQTVNLLSATFYRVQGDARSFAILALARIVGLSLAVLLILWVFHWGLLGIMLTRLAVLGATAAYELATSIRKRLPPEADREARKEVGAAFRQFSLPLFLSQFADALGPEPRHRVHSGRRAQFDEPWHI